MLSNSDAKATENSCYFYTGEKIKHHLSDLNFAKTVEGNKTELLEV